MPMVKINREHQIAASKAAAAARRRLRAETPTFSGAAHDNNPIGKYTFEPGHPRSLDFSADRDTDWTMLDGDDRWSND